MKTRLLLLLLIFLSLVPVYSQEAGEQKAVSPLRVLLTDSASFQLKAYPNPVNHSFQFVFPPAEGGPCHLYLVDVEGRVVRTYGDLMGPEQGISLGDMPRGVYLLELRGQKSYYRRIMIE